MTLALSVVGIIAVLGFLLWYGNSQKQAGAADVKANTAEDALAKATAANRPVTDAERASVVQLFQRRS